MTTSPLSPPMQFPKQGWARFLGLWAFARAVSSAGQLFLTFRIEHRCDLTGNTQASVGLSGESSHYHVCCLIGPLQFLKEGPRALRVQGPAQARPRLLHD